MNLGKNIWGDELCFNHYVVPAKIMRDYLAFCYIYSNLREEVFNIVSFQINIPIFAFTKKYSKNILAK